MTILLRLLWVLLFCLRISAQSDNSTTNTTIDSNPDDATTGSLSDQAQPIGSFTPSIQASCFATESVNHSQAFLLPSCNTLDVWNSSLITAARYPVVEVRKLSTWSVNFSAYSDASYSSRQIVNPVNGLVAVPTSSTHSAQAQTICDQSTVNLIRILNGNPTAFSHLNASLPKDFSTADCTQNKKFGLTVLRGLDQYQKDCFAICFSENNGSISQCGFRRGLGPYDKTFNIISDPMSNAMYRLRVCPSAGWFASNVSTAVSNVFKLCSSSASCATICSGDTENSEGRLSEYKAIFNMIEHNLAPTEIQSFCTPSIILQFVKDISIVSRTMGQSDVDGSIGADDVWRYIDNLANPRTGKCQGYDLAMSELVQATGHELSPVNQYQQSSSLFQVWALRNAIGTVCLESATSLQTLCNERDFSALCARADDPGVSTKGSFQTCDDNGLQQYYNAVSDYNSKCAPLGLPERPTNGPNKQYFLPRKGNTIYMKDCFPDNIPYLWWYVGIGLGMWVVVLFLIAYGHRTGERWLASCDVTMDVCRSRAYTVAGTLWLLYAFYCFYQLFLSQVQLSTCTSGSGLCSFYFPTVLYLFLVALLWVAAFGWLMIGNNPYRQYGAIWSSGGIIGSHALSFLLVYRILDILDRSGDVANLLWYRFYQIALLCALQFGLDIMFVVYLCVRPVLGHQTFHERRNREHAAYIHEILDHEPGSTMVNKFGEYVRVFLTFAQQKDLAIPKAKEILRVLSTVTEKSKDCFIVINAHCQDLNEHHRKRASQLGVDILECCILRVEIVVGKQCLSTKEEEIRTLLLKEEILRADEEGRLEDSSRLGVELANSSQPVPLVGLLDARMLIEGLKSPLFAQALMSDCAEIYWAAATAALREFVRISGNMLVDRSCKETRKRFRDAAADIGIPAVAIDISCSVPETLLRSYIEILAGDCLSRQDNRIIALEKRARETLEGSRQQLIAVLDNAEFLHWLAQGHQGGLDRRNAYNVYSLASSCLDAFHFEHFKGMNKTSEPRNTVSALQILEDLKAKVASGILVQRANSSLNYVLGLSTSANTCSNSDCRIEPSTDKSRGPTKSMRQITFAPSILFICVGIAAIITSQQFVLSMANALTYRDLLNSAVGWIQNLQGFVSNFAVTALNLAGCINPSVIQDIQNLNPLQYAQEIGAWPPLTDAMRAAAQSPALLSVFTEAIGAVVNSMSVDPFSGPEAQKAAIEKVISGLPAAVSSALKPEFINLTRPSAVASLPVVGPTIVCLANQLSSTAVSSVVKTLTQYDNALKVPKSIILQSVSTDPCRDNLVMFNCADHWKSVYPVYMESRQELYRLILQQNRLPDLEYNASAQIYFKANIPNACQLYEELGCSSALSFSVQRRSLSGWAQSLNQTTADMTGYVSSVNDTLNYAVYYAQTRIMPCYFTGHAVAFFTAIVMAINVLYQFQIRLIQMRQGNNPYKTILAGKELATFSSTSTPTLGCMVLATAYAQYYVWAYLIFIILAVLSSEKFYVLVFNAGCIWIVIEVVLGYFIARAFLEAYVGKALIFNGTGEMYHPVLWTWYSTYLVLVNLLKGLLAGIIRMVRMIFMLIVQIGVMDRSNFPEGSEASDPAFVAFLSTLMFHHRYRNPLFTAFAFKYEQEKKDLVPHQGGQADAENATNSTKPNGSNAVKTRRRWLLAHTLRCNPGVAAYISDSVAADPDASEGDFIPAAPVSGLNQAAGATGRVVSSTLYGEQTQRATAMADNENEEEALPARNERGWADLSVLEPPTPTVRV